MKKAVARSILAAAFAAGMVSAAHATQGVTDTEIVIGSNTDLSGVFAAFAAGAVKAIQQVVEEVNADGGIHGRKLRFVVEDHQYQVPRAMQNFNKLINSDQVFAMILNLGTPQNLAGRQLMDSKQVANIFPLSLARQMLEGDISYTYVGIPSYYSEISAGIDHLVAQGGVETLCTMYIPSDFGLETFEATKDKAAELGLTFGVESSHRPEEQEFVGSVQRLREAGCDVVTTALAPRQSIIAYGTAKRLGWTDVTFVGPSGSYNQAIAKVPEGVTEGYYAVSGFSDFENRLDDPDVKAWVASYESYSGERAGTAAQLGKIAVTTLVNALEAAGPDLTAESFQAAMESLEYDDPIAGVRFAYGPSHRGSELVVISKIEGSKWIEVGRVEGDAAE